MPDGLQEPGELDDLWDLAVINSLEVCGSLGKVSVLELLCDLPQLRIFQL